MGLVAVEYHTIIFSYHIVSYNYQYAWMIERSNNQVFFFPEYAFLLSLVSCGWSFCSARSFTTGKVKVSVTDPITEWVHLALAQSRMDPFSQYEHWRRSYCSGQRGLDAFNINRLFQEILWSEMACWQEQQTCFHEMLSTLLSLAYASIFEKSVCQYK